MEVALKGDHEVTNNGVSGEFHIDDLTDSTKENAVTYTLTNGIGPSNHDDDEDNRATTSQSESFPSVSPFSEQPESGQNHKLYKEGAVLYNHQGVHEDMPF